MYKYMSQNGHLAVSSQESPSDDCEEWASIIKQKISHFSVLATLQFFPIYFLISGGPSRSARHSLLAKTYSEK